MPKPVAWFERKFSPVSETGRLPAIIERLVGTPVRLEEKIHHYTEKVMVAKTGTDWSIQEHIGHLLNLEGLWYARMSEIINDETVMSEADLSNQSTFESGYNDQDPEDLLETFEEVRSTLITLLRSVKKEDLEKSSLHPRLKIPMKIVDLAFFIAEHDDHHLAFIQFLAERQVSEH